MVMWRRCACSLCLCAVSPGRGRVLLGDPSARVPVHCLWVTSMLHVLLKWCWNLKETLVKKQTTKKKAPPDLEGKNETVLNLFNCFLLS